MPVYRGEPDIGDLVHLVQLREHKLAEHHDSKRRGLAIQLDRTIFDDDPDAIVERFRRLKEAAQTPAAP